MVFGAWATSYAAGRPQIGVSVHAGSLQKGPDDYHAHPSAAGVGQRHQGAVCIITPLSRPRDVRGSSPRA